MVLSLEEDYSCSCYLELILAAEVLFRQYVIKTQLLTCERHRYLRKRNKGVRKYFEKQ